MNNVTTIEAQDDGTVLVQRLQGYVQTVRVLAGRYNWVAVAYATGALPSGVRITDVHPTHTCVDNENLPCPACTKGEL
jgi:hypothetical protein